VRVNTLKLSYDDFLQTLTTKQFVKVDNLKSLQSQQNAFYIDENIPNLLAFHPSNTIATAFANEYSSVSIILQDKASCFPAYLLSPAPGATVLDACAAPGNKTTQLASYVGRNGRVIAIEKDKKRSETLRTMVTKAGALNCTPSCDGELSSYYDCTGRLHKD
jgi:25S rRNA (cytosine2278-C5)-methyltransferase